MALVDALFESEREPRPATLPSLFGHVVFSRADPALSQVRGLGVSANQGADIKRAQQCVVCCLAFNREDIFLPIKYPLAFVFLLSVLVVKILGDDGRLVKVEG